MASRSLGMENSRVAGNGWYLLLILPLTAGLWFVLDFLLRHRALSAWPQKAAKVRQYLSWIFAFTSIVFMWVGLTTFWEVLRGPHPFRSVLLLLVFIPQGAVLAISWWSILQKRPSARAWGIAASLIYVVASLALIIPFASWDSFPPPAYAWRYFAVFFAIGVAGLAAFTRPFARISPAPAIVHVPGDGTIDFLNKISEPLLYAGLVTVYACWVHWGSAAGITEFEQLWLRTLVGVAVGLAVTIVHELGHTVAGFAVGMRLHGFTAGPFQWHIRDDRWEFQFRLRGIFIPGGATGLVRVTAQYSLWRQLPVVVAGAFVNILTGAVALLVALQHFTSPNISRDILGFFGAWSLGLGFANLLPFKTGEIYSNGARAVQLLSRAP